MKGDEERGRREGERKLEIIYKSTHLQAVNTKTLKSSNRSNKLMFAYLLNND